MNPMRRPLSHYEDRRLQPRSKAQLCRTVKPSLQSTVNGKVMALKMLVSGTGTMSAAHP